MSPLRRDGDEGAPERTRLVRPACPAALSGCGLHEVRLGDGDDGAGTRSAIGPWRIAVADSDGSGIDKVLVPGTDAVRSHGERS
jgi:hypothetical protein